MHASFGADQKIIIKVIAATYGLLATARLSCLIMITCKRL